MLNIFNKLLALYEDVGLPATSSKTLAANIKNLIFVVAAAIALYFLVSAGFKYTTSASADKSKEAGQTIIYACLGLFIILSSYAIITWVFNIGRS